MQHRSSKSISEFSLQNKALQVLVIHIIDSAKQIYNVVYIKVINSTAGIFRNFSHKKFVMFECLLPTEFKMSFQGQNCFLFIVLPEPDNKLLISDNLYSQRLLGKDFYIRIHSTLIELYKKLKKFAMERSQGKRACIRGSEYILFEILD